MIIGFTRYTTGDPTKPYTVQGKVHNYSQYAHTTQHMGRATADTASREPCAPGARSQVRRARWRAEVCARVDSRVESLSYTEDRGGRI